MKSESASSSDIELVRAGASAPEANVRVGTELRTGDTIATKEEDQVVLRVPNKEAGILNQLLVSKEFNPPCAVILKAGYKSAFVIPTLALAVFKANSALFTSGLLLTTEDGIPILVLFSIVILAKSVFLSFAPGKDPVKTLKAFS